MSKAQKKLRKVQGIGKYLDASIAGKLKRVRSLEEILYDCYFNSHFIYNKRIGIYISNKLPH